MSISQQQYADNRTASDVYAQVSGEVVAVNDRVVNEPALVNSDPAGDGWLFKMRLGDSSELADLLVEAAYKALTG